MGNVYGIKRLLIRNDIASRIYIFTSLFFNDAWKISKFRTLSINDYTSGGDKSISLKFINSDASWYELYLKPYKDGSTDKGIYLSYYKNASSRTDLWKVIPTWLQ